ncbi:MAG: M48 family metallopeptidase [Desulforhopalus sp.]
MKRSILVIISLLFIVSCEDTNVVMLTGAAKDAATAITLSDEDVNNLARRAAIESDSRHRVASSDNRYHKRLMRLVTDIALWDGTKFDFKVYLTPDVNAFAMADGTIRVYSGLMDLMTDEELLFVIGHEMGHVVKDHSRKQAMLAYASSALRKGLASQNNEVGQIAGSLLGAFAQQLATAQFSQHEERQADLYGVAFLEEQGYDKGAAVSALGKLAELARQHTFLSSHPDPESRAKKIMSGEEDTIDEKETVLAKLFDFGKIIVASLFKLVGVAIDWLLSLLESQNSTPLYGGRIISSV